MLNLPDREAILAARDTPLPQALRNIIRHTIDADLLDLTHIVLIERGDTESALFEASGWSPLVNPIDGIRYGQAGFHPSWSFLQRKDGYFQMIETTGNDGFAFLLLIDADDDGELQTMCREYVA
ncbi:MAG TPA: hypothetical protein VJM34_04245 [Novosphingobium sp.]|nr:hypothetical protein [Novosphingobium sp.]